MQAVDTIAAVATPPGNGGVGVIRISGPGAGVVADAVFRPLTGVSPSQRAAGTFCYGQVVEADGTEIDRALCLIFRAPHSFTGEDTVEIQGHGGRVVLRHILRRVLEAGARTAEPGEFSKRAFLNGRMDLLQAEAVADLIGAGSERAAAAALEQMEGVLSRHFNALYDALLTVSADLEATLDFMEDELPPETFRDLTRRTEAVLAELAKLLVTWDEGRLLREGARVVIWGRPNAGKSTLLNALLGFERAIVTPVAGTTRDTIEETLVLDGIPLRLIDTAGLRETECAVEQEGIRRAESLRTAADAVLYVLDASQPPHPEDMRRLVGLDPVRTLVVQNKIDLAEASPSPLPGFDAVPVSLLDGAAGAAAVRTRLAEKIECGLDLHAAPHAVISERHRGLLTTAQTETVQALELLREGDGLCIVPAAEHLRTALEQLGRATGRIYHESLLDAIFSRFCVGK